MIERETPAPRSLSVPVLLAAAAVAQLFLVGPLWGHTSTGGTVLGRYTARYALVLGAWIVIALGWGAAFLARGWVVRRLDGLRLPWRYAGIVLCLAGAAAIVFAPLEKEIRWFGSLNGMLAALVLIRSLPDGAARRRRWHWGLAALAALLLVPLLIAALSNRRFTPDEAIWADRATSPYVAGGLYVRVLLEGPYPITPGREWSTAAYGWLLHHVSFNIRVGRAWNFGASLIAIAGIGLVAARLYGPYAGVISACMALASRQFMPLFDYRTDHQLPIGAAFITYAAVQARYARAARARAAWHAACGLLATLSLQLHAGGIVFAAAFSLFYLSEFFMQSYRQRRRADVMPLVWFGLGAGVGSAVYIAFNIAPVGLHTYLHDLNKARGDRLNWLPVFRRYFLADRMLAWGALAYLAWRRAPADRLLLGIFFWIAVLDVLLDRPGYPSVFTASFAIPVGALFVDGLRSAGIARGQNRQVMLAACGLFVVMFADVWRVVYTPDMGQFLRTGEFPPYVYEKLEPVLGPYLRDDDVIVSTESLIWSFPETPTLYAVGAEEVARTFWEVPGLDVWERVKPTVFIDVSGEVPVPGGLRAYLDKYEFTICHTVRLMGYRIDLYRPACP